MSITLGSTNDLPTDAFLFSQIRLSGLANSESSDSSSSSEMYRLTLKDYPMHNLKNLAMMPGRSLELQTFTTAVVEGHQARDSPNI
jgi:hypothetical protein